ncbi:MAG: hypothetical protein JWO11_4107 [Nocardioides sp.]|nr:hypothetical protein [Nocardioides sp.]
MPSVSPCLIKSRDSSGELVVRVGVPLLDPLWDAGAVAVGPLKGPQLAPKAVGLRGVTRVPLHPPAVGGPRSRSNIASGYEAGCCLDAPSHGDFGRVHLGWDVGYPHGLRRERQHGGKSVRGESSMQDRLHTSRTPVVGKCWLRPADTADALRPRRKWRHRRDSLGGSGPAVRTTPGGPKQQDSLGVPMVGLSAADPGNTDRFGTDGDSHG